MFTKTRKKIRRRKKKKKKKPTHTHTHTLPLSPRAQSLTSSDVTFGMASKRVSHLKVE
jgi:hypothetical protein